MSHSEQLHEGNTVFLRFLFDPAQVYVAVLATVKSEAATMLRFFFLRTSGPLFESQPNSEPTGQDACHVALNHRVEGMGRMICVES